MKRGASWLVAAVGGIPLLMGCSDAPASGSLGAGGGSAGNISGNGGAAGSPIMTTGGATGGGLPSAGGGGSTGTAGTGAAQGGTAGAAPGGSGSGGKGPAGGASAGAGAGGTPSCADGPPTTGLKVRLNAGQGITLEGSSVSAWADQSGQNNPPAEQNDGGRRPTVKMNAINGRPVVHFDGDNDYLALPFPINGKDHLTIAAVSRTWVFQSGSPNNDCDFDKDGLTDVGRELNCSGTDQSLITWPEGNGEFASTGIFYGIGQTEATFRFGTGEQYPYYKTPFVLLNPPGDAFVWSAGVLNGASRRFYLNGTIPTGRLDYRDDTTMMLETATEPGEPTALTRAESIAHIGRGRFEPATSFWAGDLAELFIYDTSLDAEGLKALGNYIKCTYALD